MGHFPPFVVNGRTTKTGRLVTGLDWTTWLTITAPSAGKVRSCSVRGNQRTRSGQRSCENESERHVLALFDGKIIQRNVNCIRIALGYLRDVDQCYLLGSTININSLFK